MFNQLIEDITDKQMDIKYIDSSVEEFIDLVNVLTHEIRNANRRLNYKIRDPRRANRVADNLLKQIKKDAPTILIKSIDEAIGINNEFDFGVYRTFLYKVAKDPTIYMVQGGGAGWESNRNVTIRVVFESAAGTLSDYARGITSYRQKLKTKVNTKAGGGAIATRAWLKGVYERGDKLTETIYNRVILSGREAPFWQLLNSGTTALESDRADGSYNPLTPSVPTGFIDDAEDTLKSLYINTYSLHIENWRLEVQGMMQELEVAKSHLFSFFDLKNQITSDFEQAKRVIRKLGKSKKYVDDKKVAEAIRKFRVGQEFDSTIVELTRAGAPSRTRPTVRRLQGLIED